MKKEEQKAILTDEDIDRISDDLNEFIKGTNLQYIAELPSNNGIEETPKEDRGVGEEKVMDVIVSDETGEYIPVGESKNNTVDFKNVIRYFDNNKIVESEDKVSYSEDDIYDYLKSDAANAGIISEMNSDNDISREAVLDLLNLVNAITNGEKVTNIYNLLPKEIKVMIDRYVVNSGIPIISKEAKEMRKIVAEALIDEFTTNIGISKVQNDLNKEIEDIFKQGTNDITDTIIGYTKERNDKYRKAAEEMEDENKKKQMLAILDQIDEAYNLTRLIEFSKKCKIKKIELEKADSRVYSPFLSKYEDSKYNIYDIRRCREIFIRNLATEDSKYNEKHVDAFFIAFCKQCNNMRPNSTTDHAYMYYVLYNCMLIDINKGKEAEVSLGFLDNVKTVIDNLIGRNSELLS